MRSSYKFHGPTHSQLSTFATERMRENEFVEAISWSWFRDTIQVAHATTADEPGLPQQDPRFRKLVEGIQYSSRLILTYHLIVITFILLASILHWSQHVLRWRKRRGAIYDRNAERTDGKKVAVAHVDEISSGSSSTTGAISSPPHEQPMETTHLLHGGLQAVALYPKRTLFSPAKAFLMYQTRPIPFLNKTLPSNGLTALLLAFLALCSFFTFFHINFNIFELFVWADRCGLVFAANLPLLYILAAKTQPLRILTGYSYESLNIWHRRLGEVLCLEALLHTLGMFGVWYTLLRPATFTFLQFLLNRVVVLGLLALIAYELLYFTSLGSFRQRWYELFLGTHVILQILALGFVFFHHPRSRIYVGLALAIFLVDRLVYRLALKSTTVQATIRIMEDGDTVKLSTQIYVRPSLSTLMGKSISAGWSATDHVFVTIPSLGRKHGLQAHPFTIASPAPTATHEEAPLDLIIRAQDGFSADLLSKARTHKNFNVRLDGPYGSSHAMSLLQDADLAIVVAGGSGIAVAWPILNHLLHVSHSNDTERAIRSSNRQEIVFIWVIRQENHTSWIGEQALEDIKMRGVRVVIPGATEVVGRPDLKATLEDIVKKTGIAGRIGVVASGPDDLGRTVRNTCADLTWKGMDVGVTIEKFGW